MHKFKKYLAATLAMTMVLGAPLTVCAGDNDGSATGAGTSEGHVDKKATNVVLPTIAAESTPFAYTMDPEGLIAETAHAKYGNDVLFPASDDDTQVYFNNGKLGGETADKDKIVYANTSAAQTVTNKSSHAISLTVTVEASSAATDIPLVAESALATATDASLYLGLIVGSENAVAVTTDTAATQTVTVAGTPDNFKIAVKSDNSGYEYRALTLDEYKALEGNSSKTQDDLDATWATSTFQLEGAVTTDKAIESTTTAPTLTVTWSWVDPSATQEMYAYWDANAKSYWIGTTATVGFTTDATTITALTFGGKDVAAGASITTASDGTKWVKLPWTVCTSAGVAGGQASYDITLTLGGVNYEYTVH